MSNAKRDENNVTTLMGALSTDGTTPTLVAVNPSNHALKVDDNPAGSDHGVLNAPRDENGVPVLMAVSSTTATVGGISYVQGVTPVVVYADSSNRLLIDST